MTAQLAQDSPQSPVLDYSRQIAESAALLITSLRGVPFELPENPDWGTLLDLAQKNGVLLMVLQSVLENGFEVPSFFIDAAHRSRMAAERLATELEALLDGFAQERIEVLPLKGPMLSSMLYNDAAMRAPNDLDLLVRYRDLSRAETFLSCQGFRALESHGEYHRRLLRGYLLVELHFELAPPRPFLFAVHDIWSRSHRGDFRGKPVCVMSKEDLVLYLCYHGSKHGFSRLMWILDIAHALRGWPDRDYESLLVQARRQGLTSWLFIGCEVVRAMLPHQLPEAMDVVIASSPKVALRARRVAEQLFSEDLEANLYRQQFRLRTEKSVLQRWCCRFRRFRPTDLDYQWAHRHQIKPELMIIIRPFRMIEKYGLLKLWHALFPSRV